MARVMLVDAHQHVGDCRVFDLDVDDTLVLDSIAEHQLDHVLVMPFPGARDAAAIHTRIADLSTSTGGTVRGIVNLNPHQDHGAYRAEAERCVTELGFIALKLHTMGHAVDPASTDGQMVFAEATRLGVPVIVHTGGPGDPFSRPARLMPAAQEWSDTPIVLAHAGMGVASHEAGIIAQQCPNMYLETSWCGTLDTAMLAEMVGTRRMLMGSDAAVNVGIEIAKHHAIGLSGDDLTNCLGATAARVFGL
jgi:predicted TIM-barrel fold metal-dependent hydrolase